MKNSGSRLALWRETVALLALLFWVTLAAGLMVVAAEWACRGLGEPWSFAPVAA